MPDSLDSLARPSSVSTALGVTPDVALRRPRRNAAHSAGAPPLRIALLSYRGNPRSGGQGIYVRLLSRELVALGHEVDVWSGPPYPEVPPGVRLRRVPSLDLWNPDAFFRLPTLRELRDPIHVSEWLQTMTGGFPEPLTFGERVLRAFRQGAAADYDIVHDNQSLGPALLELGEMLPVVATIHHPVTIDRRIALQDTRRWRKRYGLRRWYTFLSAQLSVSRQLDRVLTVSDASAQSLHREYGIPLARMRNVGNGIDVDTFRPQPEIPRNPRRVLTTLSADSPLKGFRYLLEAMSLLRRRCPGLELVVVGEPAERTRRRVRRLGLQDAVRFTGRLQAEDIAELYASAAVAVVPSLYEGFGFPAGEAMACAVPVVATRAGALPEVVGLDGETGVLVDPASAESLADGIQRVLQDPTLQRTLGEAGHRRVHACFTWRRAAERTVEVYRELMDARRVRAC